METSNSVVTTTCVQTSATSGPSLPVLLLKQAGRRDKNIHLVDGNDEPVEGSSDKIKGLVLKVCFLKKALAISTCFHDSIHAD